MVLLALIALAACGGKVPDDDGNARDSSANDTSDAGQHPTDAGIAPDAARSGAGCRTDHGCVFCTDKWFAEEVKPRLQGR